MNDIVDNIGLDNTPESKSDIFKVIVIAELLLLVNMHELKVIPTTGGYLSIGEFVMFAIVVIASVVWLLKPALRHHTKLIVPVLAILYVSAASMLLSSHKGIALRVLFRWSIEGGTLFLAVSLLSNHRIYANALVRSALLLLTASFIIELGTLMENNMLIRVSHLFRPKLFYGYYRAMGVFENPTILGIVSVFGALLALHCATKKAIPVYESILGLISSCGLFILSATLNGWFVVTLVCITMVMGLLFLKKWKTPLITVIFIVVAVMLVYHYHPTSRERIDELFNDISTHANAAKTTHLRIMLWKAGVKAWLANPWLGVGPGVFSFRVQDYGPSYLANAGYNAHNGPIGILSEIGLIGFEAVAALLYVIFKPLYASTKGIDRLWIITWFIALTGSQLIDFTFYSYSFALYVIIIVVYLYQTCRIPLASAMGSVRNSASGKRQESFPGKPVTNMYKAAIFQRENQNL